MIERADLEALPYALVGAVQGVLRYYVARPVAEAVQGWIDGHAMTQEELDQYIGEMAAQLPKMVDSTE